MLIPMKIENMSIPGIKLKVLNVNKETLTIKIQLAIKFIYFLYNLRYLDENKADATIIHAILIEMKKFIIIAFKIKNIVKKIPKSDNEYEKATP